MKESPEELAGLYVLDRLGAGERAAFEARLLDDPGLAALVHDLESGLAYGIHALPPREPPAGTLDRIEGRLDALRATDAIGKVSVPAFRWTALARWGLAAVIAISLGTLAVQSLRPARPMVVFVGLEAGRNTFAELPLRGPARDVDARFMQLATLAEKFWDKPGDLPVKPDPAGGGNRAYALFDPASQQGFIAIEQLPVPAENQRYHLWIVDPATARISDAGILPLASLNRGLYSFMLGPPVEGNKSRRPEIFITAEENSASVQPARPQGKVVLGRQGI